MSSGLLGEPTTSGSEGACDEDDSPPHSCTTFAAAKPPSMLRPGGDCARRALLGLSGLVCVHVEIPNGMPTTARARSMLEEDGGKVGGTEPTGRSYLLGSSPVSVKPLALLVFLLTPRRQAKSPVVKLCAQLGDGAFQLQVLLPPRAPRAPARARLEAGRPTLRLRELAPVGVATCVAAAASSRRERISSSSSASRVAPRSSSREASSGRRRRFRRRRAAARLTCCLCLAPLPGDEIAASSCMSRASEMLLRRCASSASLRHLPLQFQANGHVAVGCVAERDRLLDFICETFSSSPWMALSPGALLRVRRCHRLLHRAITASCSGSRPRPPPVSPRRSSAWRHGRRGRPPSTHPQSLAQSAVRCRPRAPPSRAVCSAGPPPASPRARSVGEESRLLRDECTLLLDHRE